MDNKEEVLNALEDFGRKPSENVPQILEDYLRQVAQTGVTIFPWCKMKPLFEQRLDNAMKEFHSRVPMESLPSSPNVENVSFDTMRERLLAAVKTFTGAPFTIQRLCELVTNPGKHYKRTDKFLRGIEKNILVVSTVDPFGRKIVNEASQMMVNGMESNNSVSSKADMGGSTTDKISSPFVPPAPSNSPIASGDWFSSRNVDSPSRFPQWSASDSQTQNPLQALDKITEATCSSTSAALSKPVWSSGNTLAELTASDPPVVEATEHLQPKEGVLSDADKNLPDNVSSSSDSSTNESPLSDLSNDSEAEFTTKSESVDTEQGEGEQDSKIAAVDQSCSPDNAVTTSEAGSVYGVDKPEEATKEAADISSEEIGQGDRATSASTTADDIECRRSSGGFETTGSVVSAMSEEPCEEEMEEPKAKKARLDDDTDLDLSSSSTPVEEPSQSQKSEIEEENVHTTEGVAAEEMGSEVEPSEADNLQTEADDSMGFTTQSDSTEGDLVESSDSSRQDSQGSCNMEDSESSVSSQSDAKVEQETSDSTDHVPEPSQCDSLSAQTECDSSPKDQHTAELEQPEEPMETEEA